MSDEQIMQSVMSGAGNGSDKIATAPQGTAPGFAGFPPAHETANVTAPSQQGPQPMATPAASPDAQVSSAVAPSPANAEAAENVRHNLVGRGVQSIMSALHGGSGSKPGDIFRHIVAGALLGGAAGADTDPQKGFLGGLAKGGGAVIKYKEEQDAKRRDEQREDQKLGIEQKRLEEEQRNHIAQEGLWQAQMVHYNTESDRIHQEIVQKRNERAEAMEKVYKDANGVPSHLVVNGKPVDGSVSAEAISTEMGKSPEAAHTILFAGPGYVRKFLDTTDQSEVQYDPSRNMWVNESGQKVDMTDKISIKAFDVPVNAMKEAQPHSSAELHKLFPSQFPAPKAGQEDNVFQMTPEQMHAALQNETKTDMEQERTRLLKADEAERNARAAKERAALLKGAATKAKDHAAQLEKIVTEKKKAMDAAEKISDPKKREKAKQGAQDHYEEGIRVLGKDPGHGTFTGDQFTPAGQNAPASQANLGGVAMVLPNGTTGTIPADQVDAFMRKYPQARRAAR